MQSNLYFKLTDATLTFTSDYSFIDLFEQFDHARLHVLFMHNRNRDYTYCVNLNTLLN